MVDTFCLYEFMVLPFSWWPVATVYGVVVSLIYIFCFVLWGSGFV